MNSQLLLETEILVDIVWVLAVVGSVVVDVAAWVEDVLGPRRLGEWEQVEAGVHEGGTRPG